MMVDSTAYGFICKASKCYLFEPLCGHLVLCVVPLDNTLHLALPQSTSWNCNWLKFELT